MDFSFLSLSPFFVRESFKKKTRKKIRSSKVKRVLRTNDDDEQEPDPSGATKGEQQTQKRDSDYEKKNYNVLMN